MSVSGSNKDLEAVPSELCISALWLIEHELTYLYLGPIGGRIDMKLIPLDQH